MRFFPCPPFPPVPHPSALAGPLQRAPVAVPASAAGRAATLPRGGRAGGPFWLVMLATAAPPLKPRAPSLPRGCRGAYWVAGAVWLAWLPSATVWCVRVRRGRVCDSEALGGSRGRSPRAMSIRLALLVVLVPLELVDRFLPVGGIHVSEAITFASMRKCLT